MKPNTEIVLGIRHVGASDQPIEMFESIMVEDALKKIIEFTLQNSMAQRFQFSMARTKADAMVGLGKSQNTREANRKAAANRIADSLTATLKNMDFVE